MKELNTREVRIIADILMSASKEEIRRLEALEVPDDEIPGSNLGGWPCLGGSTADKEATLYVRSTASLEEAMAVGVWWILDFLDGIDKTIEEIEINWFTIDRLTDVWEVDFGISYRR